MSAPMIGVRTLRERCVDDIMVKEDTPGEYIQSTVGIVTALNPVIGSERSSDFVAESYRINKGILKIIWQP